MGKARERRAVLPVHFRDPATLERFRLVAKYYGESMTRLAEDWLTERLDESTEELADQLQHVAAALRGGHGYGGADDQVAAEYAKAESEPDPIRARRVAPDAAAAIGRSIRRPGRRSPFAGLEPGERELGR